MPPSISYTIAMPRPQTHLYEVTLTIAASAGPTLDVALPVWTPGSYMVREYARHVQEFAATADGQPLPWRKLDKSTWRIAANNATPISISYKVYANELSVRTSHLDASHGYFNPATLCMYIPGRTAEPASVRVITPEGWRVTTALRPERDSEPQSFIAQDYDELVDSPFECGTHRLLNFAVDGIPHDIALWGHGNEDADRIVADTQKIVVAARDFFGGLPYTHYTFIVHLSSERGGGLEHRNSVTMLINRWGFQPYRTYERYLQLTAHEFFHVWNVKRIRAAPLGPFDYSRENYTRQLWAMEGVTEYYTDILLLRAGLITPERYRELLAEAIAALQSQPGRAQQSLEQSSFDAWIKFYRSDENTPNSAISYYLKGALVALLLDLEIRQRTASERSLDDVLRYLYRVYPLDGPGIPEDGGYRAAVEAVVASATTPGDARSFATFFERSIAGTDELDYDRGLGFAGLRLDWSYERRPEDGRPPVWLGLKLKTESGRPKVSVVLSNGPAYLAGVAAGDELLALDGYRTSEDDLNARLAERRPGDSVTLTLFRRDELMSISITLAAAPCDKLTLRPLDQPTDEQRQLYLRWIGVELTGAAPAIR